VVNLSRRILLCLLAVSWLAGVMCCPLEAAGVFSVDYCCGTSLSAPVELAYPAQSACVHGQSARVLPLRGGGLLLPVGPAIHAGISTPLAAAVDPGASASQPGAELSALAQGWQFCWRTAAESRAPSFLS
jgi:hypothetical protein